MSSVRPGIYCREALIREDYGREVWPEMLDGDRSISLCLLLRRRLAWLPNGATLSRERLNETVRVESRRLRTTPTYINTSDRVRPKRRYHGTELDGGDYQFYLGRAVN